MPDVDFVDTEDVAWATGEDVEFEGARVRTTLQFNFLFDNGDRIMEFDNEHRSL